MPLRKWRFTSGISAIESPAGGTDFWFLPAAGADGARSYTIHDAWELTPSGEVYFPARRAFETRIENLTAMSGRVGTLEIDYGEAFQKMYSGVRFNGFRPSKASNNAILVFDLEFEFPVPGTIARTLQFGLDADGFKLVVAAGNFALNYSYESRSVFKFPVRAAPIRIEGGPGLKTLNITAIQQAVTDSTALSRRQSLEAVIRNIAWNYKGRVKPLKVDGVFLESSADFELKEVRASQLSLPDSLTYDLEFVTGFVS